MGAGYLFIDHSVSLLENCERKVSKEFILRVNMLEYYVIICFKRVIFALIFVDSANIYYGLV